MVSVEDGASFVKASLMTKVVVCFCLLAIMVCIAVLINRNSIEKDFRIGFIHRLSFHL